MFSHRHRWRRSGGGRSLWRSSEGWRLHSSYIIRQQWCNNSHVSSKRFSAPIFSLSSLSTIWTWHWHWHCFIGMFYNGVTYSQSPLVAFSKYSLPGRRAHQISITRSIFNCKIDICELKVHLVFWVPTLRLNAVIMEFDEKKTESNENFPVDPFATNPRNAYSSFTHAILATALFRCWQVVTKSQTSSSAKYSLQAHIATLWHLGDRRMFD